MTNPQVNRTSMDVASDVIPYEILDFTEDKIYYATTEKDAVKKAIGLAGAFIMRHGEVVAVWRDRKFKAYGEIFRLIEQNESEILDGQQTEPVPGA